jgi:transposase InsO family protein
MEQKVLDIYREYGYPSVSTLLKILKENGIITSKSVVEKVIQAHSVYQLHKKKKVKYTSHLTAFLENQIWQIDLLDMQKYAHANKGYKWILLLVDIFSRKAEAIPLKSKNTTDIIPAFNKLLADVGIPHKIISDNGSEFISKQFVDIIHKHKILHELVEVGYHPSLGIIDRLSRTVKEKIEKHFTHTGTAKWIDFLPKIISSYNNTPHSGLANVTPNRVKEFGPLIRKLNVDKNIASDKKIQLIPKGQLVRVRLKKPMFTKGYKQEWSTSTFKVKEAHGVNATLDNGDIVKINDLQFVTEVHVPTRENVQQQKIESKAKTIRKVKQEGLTTKDIRKGLRERKPANQLEDEKYGRITY